MTFATFLLIGILAATPTTAPHPPIEEIANQFLANFTKGNFEAACKDFNDNMSKTVTPSILGEMRQEAASRVGEYRSVTATRVRRENGLRAIDMTLSYEKSLVALRVSFDANDRISAVFFNPFIEKPDPLLAASARALFANFMAGQFENVTHDFNRAMQVQLPPSQLAELRKKTMDAYGPFRSITDLHQRTDKGYKIIDLIAAWGDVPVVISVVFDAESRVGGLRIARKQ